MLRGECLTELDKGKFFTKSERRWRVPLGVVAQELLTESFSGLEVSVDSSLGALFNMSALIHYRAGCVDEAFDISNMLIMLACTLATQRNDPRWYYHALQPYINLIRLRAAAMDGETAMSCLDCLEGYVLHGKGLVVGDHSISSSLLSLPTPNGEDVLTVCKNALIGERVRCYMLQEAYAEALEFSRGERAKLNESTDTHNVLFLIESEMRALIATGMPDAALNLAKEFSTVARLQGSVYLGLHELLAQAYLLMERRNTAETIVVRAHNCLEKSYGAVPEASKPVLAQTIVSFVAVALDLGRTDLAIDFGAMARHLMTGERDEILEAKLLVAGLEADSYEDSVAHISAMSYGLEKALLVSHLHIGPLLPEARVLLNKFGRYHVASKIAAQDMVDTRQPYSPLGPLLARMSEVYAEITSEDSAFATRIGTSIGM